jgi:hypothetical protein
MLIGFYWEKKVLLGDQGVVLPLEVWVVVISFETGGPLLHVCTTETSAGGS